MPQPSVYYAAGRISMLRRDALDASRLERLLSAASLEEAKRTLSEIGWSNAEDGDWEQLARKRVADAAVAVRKLTTDPKVTDCFLLKYDVSNLKMLLKARCLGTDAGELYDCGLLPVDKLRHDVAEHAYANLPEELRKAMNGLENLLAVSADPLTIDVKLDQAMFRQIFADLKGTKCKAAVTYFQARVDMLNASSLLRIRRMGKDVTFYGNVLLSGGTVPDRRWRAAFEAPDQVPSLLSKYGTGVRNAAAEAVMDFSKLPALEKAVDNGLLKLFTPYKYDMMRLESTIAYLLASEREASAVRLVMAAKANGFSDEAVRERLRDLYD